MVDFVARMKGGKVNYSNNNPLLISADRGIGNKEVLRFPYDCPHCTKPADTDMCVMDIIHLKKVVILSLTCK